MSTAIERAYRRYDRLLREANRLVNKPESRNSRRQYVEIWRQLKQAQRIIQGK